MEHWRQGQLAKGNFAAAKIAEGLIEQFDDIPLSPVATPEKQLAKVEAVKIYPEISLAEEWNRQAQNLAKLFAKELKFDTSEKYVATLPKFEPQPEDWKGRLDTPVLVETRISLRRQCELAGIEYSLEDGVVGGRRYFPINNWNKNLKDYVTPKTPYVVWLEDGKNNLGKKIGDVRKKLRADEVCGTGLDGIALYISKPKILEDHGLYLPGTSIGYHQVAALAAWNEQPAGLYHTSIGYADSELGVVVCGKQK